MILGSCQHCKYHEIQESESTQMSYCRKENCWSRYSKCLTHQAIDRFLDQDRVDTPQNFSAVAHLYKEE